MLTLFVIIAAQFKACMQPTTNMYDHLSYLSGFGKKGFPGVFVCIKHEFKAWENNIELQLNENMT